MFMQLNRFPHCFKAEQSHSMWCLLWNAQSLPTHISMLLQMTAKRGLQRYSGNDFICLTAEKGHGNPWAEMHNYQKWEAEKAKFHFITHNHQAPDTDILWFIHIFSIRSGIMGCIQCYSYWRVDLLKLMNLSQSCPLTSVGPLMIWNSTDHNWKCCNSFIFLWKWISWLELTAMTNGMLPAIKLSTALSGGADTRL